VEIVLGDLKVWETHYKFDLIVSELLGSFGDNELSAECLGWA
jgi:protein arginine N-methyltransferase 5